jgi:hypothetical protein
VLSIQPGETEADTQDHVPIRRNNISHADLLPLVMLGAHRRHPERLDRYIGIRGKYLGSGEAVNDLLGFG